MKTAWFRHSEVVMMDGQRFVPSQLKDDELQPTRTEGLHKKDILFICML